MVILARVPVHLMLELVEHLAENGGAARRRGVRVYHCEVWYFVLVGEALYKLVSLA